MAQIQTASPEPIRDMFDALVPGYDRFNLLSSLGLDAGWRSRVAGIFESGNAVLDVGTGTGDLAKVLGKVGCQVTGIDFAPKMVEAARLKLKPFSNITVQVASADDLPFEPKSFEGITSSFVIRNLHKGGILSHSFREFYRVLKPGGQMVHLELTRPRNPVLAWGHKAYMNSVVPLIGRSVFGGNWPKDYLSETIAHFPESDELCRMIRWAGFERSSFYPLSGGIATLFIGARC